MSKGEPSSVHTFLYSLELLNLRSGEMMPRTKI